MSTEATTHFREGSFQATILIVKQGGQKASTFNQKCDVGQCSIVYILLS